MDLAVASTSSRRDASAHSNNQKSSLTENDIDRLFVRLNSMYGAAWTSRFKAKDPDMAAKLLMAAKREWAFGLADFSMNEIGGALGLAKKECKEYPPSLPKFESLCLSYRKIMRSEIAASTPALPGPHAGKTIEEKMSYARPFIQRLRQACSGGVSNEG